MAGSADDPAEVEGDAGAPAMPGEGFPIAGEFTVRVMAGRRTS